MNAPNALKCVQDVASEIRGTAGQQQQQREAVPYSTDEPKNDDGCLVENACVPVWLQRGSAQKEEIDGGVHRWRWEGEKFSCARLAKERGE